MVEVFKTNVQKKTQSKKYLCVLSEAFPSFKINFDLLDCDKVLRVEGEKMPSPQTLGISMALSMCVAPVTFATA